MVGRSSRIAALARYMSSTKPSRTVNLQRLSCNQIHASSTCVAWYPPAFTPCLEHFGVRRGQAQSIAIERRGEHTVRVDQHMVPVVGLKRVVGVVEASKHAQQRRLFRPLGRHLVVALEGIGELRNSEEPVHHAHEPQAVRLARAVDEFDPVRNRGANLCLGQHELILEFRVAEV